MQLSGEPRYGNQGTYCLLVISDVVFEEIDFCPLMGCVLALPTALKLRYQSPGELTLSAKYIHKFTS